MRHKDSYNFHAKYLLVTFLGFHKNLRIEESSLLHIVARTFAVENEYVGKARETNLIKVLLPAHDSALLLHPISLDSILSIKYLKSLVLLLEEKIGVSR